MEFSDVDWDNELNFKSVPSLERISMVALAVKLWNSEETLRIVYSRWWNIYRHEENNEYYLKFFRKLHKRVERKVASLYLPKKMKANLLRYISPIGAQLFKWIEDRYSYEFKKYINQICWTPDGVVDKLTTLRRIEAIAALESENTGRSLGKIRTDLFYFACFCCAEDDILDLWRNLSSDEKLRIRRRNQRMLQIAEQDVFDAENFPKENVIFYWICSCRGKLNEFWSYVEIRLDLVVANTVDQYMFYLALCKGFSLVTKYFWLKLSYQEKSETLMRSFGRLRIFSKLFMCYQEIDNVAEVMCYLLSHLSDEDRRKIYRMYGFQILNCLFQSWSLQRLLIPAMHVVQQNVEKDLFDSYLTYFSGKIRKKDRSVRPLIEEVRREFDL